MLLPAHIVAPGYSLFDNGALHALLSVQVSVPLAALGLAFGRLDWRRALMCGGLIISGWALIALALPTAALPLAAFGAPVAFLAAGLALMASGTRLAAAVVPASALLLGAHLGLLARAEDAGPMFALGTAAGGAQLVLFPALAAARLWRPWLTIPARIAASWLLAVGVMFFGLALRPLPPGSTVAPETETPAQLAACPGPHRHGVNGAFICLPVPKDEPTPNIKKYDNAPPVLDIEVPQGGAQ